MTQEEIKKLDKRLRCVQDPWGTGFLAVYSTMRETAEANGNTIAELMRQYTAWKTRSL